MNSTIKKVFISIFKVVAVVAAVLLLWYLAALWTNNDLVLPHPHQVVLLTLQLLGKGTTYIALAYTLLRALAAFALSLAFALVLALFSGVCNSVRPFVEGAVTFFRALPTIAVILVAMIVFPSSVVPIFVAFLVAFPIVYSAFCRETSSDRLFDVCKVYNVSASKKVRYVLLPQISQALLPQIKDTLPLCVKIVIAGEVMALPRLGLGQQMYVAKVNLLTANVLALTLLALAVCFVISGVCALCGRKK